MDKVLIITNKSKLENVNDAHENFDGIDLLETNPILICQEIREDKSTLEIAAKLQDGDIFFVSDSKETTTPEKWNTFLKTRKDENLYILHHTSGFVPAEKEDWIIQIKGKHTGHETDKYLPAITILSDNDPNKKERIIKEVFKSNLETVLVFLHGCLEKKPEDADYEKLKAALEISTLSKLEGDPYDKKYLDSLGKLSKELVDNFG